MDDERLTVTVDQAARMLGISRGLAYQMVHDGKLPSLQFGRRLVVPRWAIERMLQGPHEATGSPHPSD